MGKHTARIAAAALSAASPDIAVPLLEDALPRLESSRDHQRVAAHALAHLKGDEPLAGWATSANPALRLVAAERHPPTVGGGLNPLLGKLTHDPDRAVAVAAVRNVADARTTEAAEHSRTSPARRAKIRRASTADPRIRALRIIVRIATSFRLTRPRPPVRCSLSSMRSHMPGRSRTPRLRAGPVLPPRGPSRDLLAQTVIRSTITQIYEGTNQIQRMVMARQLLK